MRDVSRPWALTSVVFVSHELGVVRTIAHRALILHRGEVREAGEVSALFDNLNDPYTRELISSIPTFEPSSLSPGLNHV